MADDIDAIPTHITQVLGTERVSEHYVRVTVGGGLERYTSIGPDEFVYVLLPPIGKVELAVDASFSWPRYFEQPEEERPVGAYYSVRAWRPAVGEIDLDVYLHEEHGPVSGWAPTAKAGDPVALWGPRTAYHPPAEVDWWLLVADETGLPATARILAELPIDAVVRAVVEVPDASEEQVLPLGPNAEVTWLHRDGRESATTTHLLEAVRELPFPAGRPYIWGGGESRSLTSIRRYVRQELGYERERVSLTP